MVVDPGEKLEVKLASTPGSGSFKGFLIVGRTSNFLRDTTPHGKFTREITSGSGGYEAQAKIQDCLNVPSSSATHVNRNDKDMVILEWEAPQEAGEYIIVVTVVKNKEIFWVAAPSPIITVGSGTEPEPGDEIKAIYEGCSKTKGCFGTPNGCLGTRNCAMFVTYTIQPSNGNAQFELVGNVKSFNSPTSYVALGLSDNNRMGDDSVLACRMDQNTIAVNEYYTRPEYHGNFGVSRAEFGIISQASGVNVDGFISCKFTVLPAYEVDVPTERVKKSWDLASNNYYLLLARGNDANEGALDKHPGGEDRITSLEPRNITDVNGPEPPPPPPPPPPSEGLVGVYEGCGNTKGCFGLGVSGCVGSRSCEMVVTYQITGNSANLQLAGRQIGDSSSYVAVGLSRDNIMGEDHVFGCRLDRGSVVVSEYYNRPNRDGNDGVVRRDAEIISNPTGTAEDGYLLCSFTVDKTYTVPIENSNSVDYDLGNEAFFLLLARGTESAVEFLGKHPSATDRGASSSSVKFSDASVVVAKSNIYIQLHGSFMILAWLLCASSGMFTARYYKQTHTRRQPWGLAIWFHIHRTCMSLTVLFTVAGFVFIFVEVGGLTSWNGGNAEKSHPILGIILTALALLQVCLALVRPHPGNSKRPLFNWAHWSVGNSAHIIGLACIYLANNLQKTNLQQTRYWGVITGFIAYHIVLHIALTILTFQADQKMEIQEKKRALSVGPMPSAGVSGEAPGTEIRTVIYAAYILGAASTAISLIYFVVDALQS
ncbi:unnamed protein product [Allacma fusca]|uniref:Ferric-chelate reductase 1 n=1 Tax=Allacma fusca TaxID=39272 RepID=A0A8J2LTY9_9HEXA|nr:unnamed protein product [Allacma fusca]